MEFWSLEILIVIVIIKMTRTILGWFERDFYQIQIFHINQDFHAFVSMCNNPNCHLRTFLEFKLTLSVCVWAVHLSKAVIVVCWCMILTIVTRIILKMSACVSTDIFIWDSAWQVMLIFSMPRQIKSRKTTVMAAVFLIVPVSYYKKAISSGSTSLRGAVLKRSVGIWWLFYSVRSLLEIWRKFSNALKTAAEVKSFKNSQQGFVQELGATPCMWLCRYTGVCVCTPVRVSACMNRQL